MLSLALAIALCVAPPTGRWEGNGFALVLDGSGAGSISMGAGAPPEPITWKLSGSALLITQGGDTIPYSMTVTRDSMTLTAAVLEAPLTLHRTGSATSKGSKQPALPPQPAQPEPLRPVKQQQPPPPKQVQGPPPGTCEAACQHYVKCANLPGQDQLTACVINCYAGGANAYQLANFQQLPCDQAIAVVVAMAVQAAQAQGQQQRGNRGGNNKGSRCNGCVRDGNDCVWISQSNWGTGNNSPYSGAVSSCDADCCQ